jgi:hypothetical protein
MPLRAALAAVFESASDGYSNTLDALAGAMLQASDAVQDVVFDKACDECAADRRRQLASPTHALLDTGDIGEGHG